jgi:hypothetical protein
MSPASLKLAVVGVFALLLITVIGVWKVQDWRYGEQWDDQVELHQDDLAAIGNAAAAQSRRSGQASRARAAPFGQRPDPSGGFDQFTKRPSSPA